MGSKALVNVLCIISVVLGGELKKNDFSLLQDASVTQGRQFAWNPFSFLSSSHPPIAVELDPLSLSGGGTASDNAPDTLAGVKSGSQRTKFDDFLSESDVTTSQHSGSADKDDENDDASVFGSPSRSSRSGAANATSDTASKSGTASRQYPNREFTSYGSLKNMKDDELLRILALSESSKLRENNEMRDLELEEKKNRNGNGDSSSSHTNPKVELLDILQDFLNDEIDAKKRLIRRISKTMGLRNKYLQYITIGLLAGAIAVKGFSLMKGVKFQNQLHGVGGPIGYSYYRSSSNFVNDLTSFVYGKINSFNEMVDKLKHSY